MPALVSRFASRRSAVVRALLAAALLLALPSACGDDPPADQGYDLLPPDFWIPPDIPDGFGQYGETSTSTDTGSGNDIVDTATDTGPQPGCENVTFAYDDAAATSVWVTGSFTDWAPTPALGALELTHDGAGHWTLDTTIATRGRHHYKLIVDGNRWIADPANTDTVDDLYFDQNSVLDVCGSTPEPQCGVVTFRYTNDTATTVLLAGSFTNWQTGALPMVDSGGLWTTTATLPNGQSQYKFVVDGAWITDPVNPNRIDDTFGGFNSALNVQCGPPPAGQCGDVAAFDWRDAVMYFVMVDRFYDANPANNDPVVGVTGDNGHGSSGQYEGGDLVGVTQKLGYLTDLGVTAIWLSAPYENRNTRGQGLSDSNWYSAYHGYWPSPANVNYADPLNPSPVPAVESRIGTAADLHAFVDAAHAADSADGHGVKVLFDYVMNHVDKESGLYQAHGDWFAKDGSGNTVLCGPGNLWDDAYWGTRCAFADYLPAFDFDIAAARKWSVDDALWWAHEYGIDGYRLDAIKHVPMAWLTDLRSRLNAEFPSPAGDRFYLVGETFDYGNRDLLKRFVDPATKLDGQFDFPFKANACQAVFRPEGSLNDLANWMQGNDGYYGPGSLMTTWIGNHDIPRAIHFASGQITSCMEGSHAGNAWTSDYNQPTDAAPYERLGVVFAIMMTNPGIPLIYYGDEIGLAGGGDPDNRRVMVFDDAALSTPQKALRSRISQLAHVRAENKALSRGQRTTLAANQDTWVYRMGGCGTDAPDVVVAVNRADGQRDVTLPSGTYTELLTGTPTAGGSLRLAPRSVAVLRVEP